MINVGRRNGAARVVQAANEEQYISQWREWRAFLAARRVLIDAAATAGAQRDSFEASADMADPARQAEAVIARIPPERRTLFAQAVEERVQQLQQLAESPDSGLGGVWLRDPDDVEREAIRQLLDDAEGRSDELPEGWAIVPMPEGWYQFDARALMNVPDAAVYKVRGAGMDDAKKRVVLAVVAVVVGLSVTMLLSLFGGSTPAPTVTASRSALVNEAPVQSWTARQITYTDTEGTATTIPLTPVRGAWPAEATAPHVRERSVAPVHLCTPDNPLAGASQVSIVSGGETATRAYTLSATAPDRPDLVVAACATGKTLWYGTLAQTEPPTPHAVGDTVPAPGDLALALTSLTIAGPGADPLLPPGQARVTALVRVTGPQTATTAIRWPDYAPALITIAGQRVAPETILPAPDGVQLTFLIPLPGAAMEMALSITPPGATQATRWHAQLDQPPSRDAVLRAALEVDVAAAAAGDTPQLQVTLINVGDAPLTVTPADIALAADGVALPLPALSALAEPLAPDERRTFTLNTPRDGRSLVLTIGVRRFQITGT